MDNIVPEIPNSFSLPRRINRLRDLTYNLWWVWNPEAQMLFSQIDKALWERTYHNPVIFLRQVERARLNAVTFDRFYLDNYDRVFRNFDSYMAAENTWFKRTYPDLVNRQIAYFSFEFGLHESLPVYAGGLGILSGDHLKEASDLNLPLVAIGFFYTQGYFSQHITEDGWQEATNLYLKFDELPIIPLFQEDHRPLMVSVDLAGRKVWNRIWKVQVGRVPLYLLDTNVEENAPADRQLTARLYTSDLELRISQEILLGIAGVHALRALGYDPNVWHMNEGHSAFLTIERIRELIQDGVPYPQAVEKIQGTDVFTTHTPVPAGNDEFPLWLIDKYFTQYWNDLGISRDQFIDLARTNHSWGSETFSMPVLALRLSNQRNAVSELHGQVSRKMWQYLWPDRRPEDVPIIHVTNGIHTGTWLAHRMGALYAQYLGTDFIDRVDDLDLWDQVEKIPDAELWAARRHLKRKLMAYIRERVRYQWLNGKVHPVQVVAAGVLLDPYMLTIGFARRFATYKRANLILHDIDRLLSILNQPNKPVQIIFAGKSHPADEPGKLLIQEVYRQVKDNRNGGRLVFLEDYDMNIARYLVQGVDVWLNTPRRPNEASGTSGQKAALNGVLNFSVLDGWWREGYNGHNGWAIGDDTEFADPNAQDQADAESLYDTLENDIIPLYYLNRTAENLPVDWIAHEKESIRTLAPQFSMRRMLIEYINQLYLPAIHSQDPERAIKEM
ncbi:MAG: alpha-glucan family phosphorylase [Chloroflexi bacterium]|nr:alpha-glucan family phosphorylase [Chloroflexota bacterium]